MIFNTKVDLNEKIIYLYEPKDKSIGLELFNALLEYSQELIMNDDGGKFKKQLSGFDISKDKIVGDWHFKVDAESKKIFPKVFEYYINRGHWCCSLRGKEFILEYQDYGDEGCEHCLENMPRGPNGKDIIYNDFKIEAKGNPLDIIKKILNRQQ